MASGLPGEPLEEFREPGKNFLHIGLGPHLILARIWRSISNQVVA
jgi:hypothetical protein